MIDYTCFNVKKIEIYEAMKTLFIKLILHYREEISNNRDAPVHHYFKFQQNLANVNGIQVERNATISILHDTCLPSSDRYLSSNFMLIPEVCLSGYDSHGDFGLLKMSRCVGHDGESRLTVLVTYSDEKCTGPAMVQPSSNMGQSPGWHIEFPLLEIGELVTNNSIELGTLAEFYPLPP